MSLLCRYERDLELPADLGEPWLCPPGDAAALELIAEHLANDPLHRPTRARLVHARWKPAFAVAALYEVEFGVGAPTLVGLKLHAGAKAARLGSGATDPRAGEHDTRLRPRATFAEGRGTLWHWIADRELRGLVRLYDRGRTKRWLSNLEAQAGLELHRRGLHYELLRYKPERRAVIALDVDLPVGRDRAGCARLIVRTLPPAHALRSSMTRRQLDSRGQGPWPRLLGVDEEAGLLYEERLPLEPLLIGNDERLHALGACLAGLHAQPVGHDDERRTLHRAHDHIDLLARVADVGWLAGLPAVGGVARRVHGDAHLGQLARSGGRFVMLDLDECSAGTAEEDLATAIAEALVHGRGDWNTATRALLDGYRSAGGPDLERGALVRAIAHALCESAAATLRRLERGAVTEAARRLELARSLPGPVVTKS
jgi:hypothetical protein